jgi:hypothetical protein
MNLAQSLKNVLCPLTNNIPILCICTLSNYNRHTVSAQNANGPIVVDNFLIKHYFTTLRIRRRHL